MVVFVFGRRFALAFGVLLVLGGVSVTADNSVAAGLVLIVVGVGIAGLFAYAQVLLNRGMVGGSLRTPTAARSDPAIRRRFQRYGVIVLALGLLTVGLTVWLAVPGALGSRGSGDGLGTFIARLLCPGALTLTLGIGLAVSGVQTLRGLLYGVGKSWVALRVLWVLALLVLADALITRPTAGWPAVSIATAVIFVIAFTVDFPLKRLIRDTRAVESRQESRAQHAAPVDPR